MLFLTGGTKNIMSQLQLDVQVCHIKMASFVTLGLSLGSNGLVFDAWLHQEMQMDYHAR